MKTLSGVLLLGLVLAAPATLLGQSRAPSSVSALKVTVLSTNLAGDNSRGIGEWGFAALVEADGRRLLVDTGARPETVLQNAVELGVDLSTVTELVISHNHSDHTGGLVTLRRELAKKNPQALSIAHVASGIFLSRAMSNGRETNGLLPVRAAYEGLGGKFVEHSGPVELAPGVWFLGPIPRVHPEERNWSGSLQLQTPSGPVDDTVPEDTSVVVNTSSGLVVLSGCCHAGIINTLEYARQVAKGTRIHAVIGGFHLFALSDDQLAWTANQLRSLGGIGELLGAHCTGIEAVYRLRQLCGLPRSAAVVAAAGSSFTLGKGLEPLSIAR
jgi:7,8-dihydropterin-6-yl-methyl-4-(beta-D-ribofuranosyl)aminobenzene 5'-phosphate synthase